ncbi:MAG: DUF4349 domain-containing protein [Robiginitomaculum sp.]|nr:DUF4349 domain-containing protein [Robiginitomaculum sp.]
MKTLIIPFTLSVLALGACQQKESYTPERDMMGGAMETAQAEMKMSSPAPMRGQSAQDKSQLLLAYRYHFNFAIPSKALETVSQKAIETCTSAGVDMCRVVSSSLNRYSDDNVSANIELRIAPKWFEDYKASLLNDSKGGGGKLTGSTTSSEDLTIAISDSGAKLGALKTLRARLTGLLETKGSDLKDLIAVERELARVQGQIESSTARLRVLRTRVSMSQLYLNYETKAVAASRSSFSPIKHALNDFIGTVAQGFAGVIRFTAFFLPWLIIGIPLLWVVRRFWRKRKANKT